MLVHKKNISKVLTFTEELSSMVIAMGLSRMKALLVAQINIFRHANMAR